MPPSSDAVILRMTRSICLVCYRELKAKVVQRDGRVFLEKECPEHGYFSVVLSSNPKFFSELSKAYFSLMPKYLPRRSVDLLLTPKCSLDCPICLPMSYAKNRLNVLSLEDVENIIKKNPQIREFVLSAMEPTEHPEIEAILMLLRKFKKKAYLQTNGLKFANYNFLLRLKNAGLSFVYLQFDGFDEDVYQITRGKNILKDKLQALENLRKLNMGTCLLVTLVKGKSENQINEIINYSVKNKFIKHICFMPLIKYSGSDSCAQDVFPGYYEFLEITERETEGRINLENIMLFQKLAYVVYRFTKSTVCFWLIFYILVRNKKGERDYKTIDEVIDLRKLNKVIDKYIEDINCRPALKYDLEFAFKLIRMLLNSKTIILFLRHLKFIVSCTNLKNAWSDDLLFLTYQESCDIYKMDLDMSDRYCQPINIMKNKQNKIVFMKSYRILMGAYK